MNYRISLFFLLLLFSACGSSVTESSLTNLNGYWEVYKVIFPDGREKTLPPSDTHDYYEFKQNKGFRKKVTPLLNGNYLVNDLKDEFKVVHHQGTFSMHFTTFLSKWTEQIKLLTQDELELESEEHYVYFYKRPQSFTQK